SQGDRARILEQQAAEPGPRPALLRLHERLTPDEPALLVELDGEPDASLVGRLVGRDVGTPHAVALLQSHRVDRPIAARDDAVRLPLFPQCPPEPGPVLARAVEL